MDQPTEKSSPSPTSQASPTTPQDAANTRPAPPPPPSTADSSLENTRCLILLPHPAFDPANILKSFRRRPVAIEIYHDQLTLLTDLATTTRNQNQDLTPNSTKIPPPTIIFLVEPLLNDDTFAFMATLEKYFPEITLLAHTQDPAAHQITSLLANTGPEHHDPPLEKVATATVTAPPMPPNQIPDTDLTTDHHDESDDESIFDDHDHEQSFFAPPAFEDDDEQPETNQNGNHPTPSTVQQPVDHTANQTDEPEADTNLDNDDPEKDERLVSEEELSMLLGDGDFLFDDGDQDDSQQPAPHPANSETPDNPA